MEQIYNYHNLHGKPSIFCVIFAPNITQADKMFEQIFGKHPAKMSYIAVRSNPPGYSPGYLRHKDPQWGKEPTSFYYKDLKNQLDKLFDN